MQTAYRFRIGLLVFILNIQYSTIGFGYPRLFIAWPDGSYTNADLYLCTLFKMTESDWMSWLDDDLVELDDIDSVRKVGKENGINIDALIDWAFAQMKNNKNEDE